ncbi:signal peptidase I [Candidatus Saccharibacteria bacterium]|nr:signal peptidase I [Candidatus Saccharibacteria bacterium]
MDIIPPRSAGPIRPVPQAAPPTAPPTAPPAAPPPSQPLSPLPPSQPRFPEDKGSFKSILSTIGLLVSAFSIAILLNTFVIQSYQVDGQSMEYTLQNDDRLIVNKIPRTISRLTGHQYVPKRGDVIIFNQSGLPGFVGQKQLIKRVIGLPGERVVVADGRLSVYNSTHPQGFDPDNAGTYQTASPTTVGDTDVTLQKDELFVCGDNRPNSEDSRYFGPIKTNQVVAKLTLRILPLNKVHKF